MLGNKSKDIILGNIDKKKSIRTKRGNQVKRNLSIYLIGCVPLSTGAAAGSPRAHGVHAHRQVEHPLTYWPTYWRRRPAPASGHCLTYWPTWQRTSAPASGTYSDLLTLILREYTDTCDWNIRWPIDLHSNGVHGGHRQVEHRLNFSLTACTRTGKLNIIRPTDLHTDGEWHAHLQVERPLAKSPI